MVVHRRQLVMTMNSPVKEIEVGILLSRLLGARSEGITINCMWKNIRLLLTLFTIVNILFLCKHELCSLILILVRSAFLFR